ncbi:GDYXXLXY domain-containing protein [Mitsuaria sp. GD03876]|uniref:GDYXXLXY domain-containing protein n=1 Tax=Mitsuaria sp. GD03876 TaxID=2975399 RepID=UPI0024494EE0|nr:GDYXXLXY domain-containing protein [Mitsuaria sp. GD03876]MDH0865659.1 GDYXXLXY domain-containing protein [Mitsuaria sp. GD03876]
MSDTDWIDRARAEGLAPATDGPVPRPWPVVLLTALGAWLAVPPFIAMFAMLFGGDWHRGPMPYIEGVGLLALAVLLLRGRATPVFLEQAAVPLLLTGGVCLGFGLTRDLSHAGAAWVGLAVGAALIVLLRQGWLRLLLGVGMAALAGFLGHLALEGIAPRAWYQHDGGLSLAAAALLLAEGLVLSMLQARLGREGRTAEVAAALEPVLTGWWIAVLVMHAVAAGWSFAAGGVLGGGFIRDVGPGLTTSHLVLLGASRALSVLLTLVAALWLLRRWQPASASRLLPPLVALAALAALMPALGGILLVLALMASTRRWRLAVLAGVAAVWALGALYYEWAMPLAHKSLALVVAGAVLAAWVRWLAWHPARPEDGGSSAVLAMRGAPAILLGAGVLALAVVNIGIAGRERLIDTGRPVFVKLAPVDPRSLMQGDFMQLNYELPGVGPRWRTPDPADPDGGPLWGRRPLVAATLDARGVVQSARLLAPGEAPPAGAQLLTLTPKDGGWTFVSDAWFFREGEAQRWQPAKYGEFRVTPDGKGLLVRVVGEDLKPL